MNTIVLAILWPFLTAIVLALVNGRYRLEKALAVLSSLGLTGWVFWLLFFVRANGVQAMVVGGWQAPWGIAFVADLLACIMLCLSMGVGAVVIIYTCWTVTEQQQKHFFYPLFFLLLVGVNWAFVTGDLFNLFVAYEVMLIASYGMMMVGASRAQVRQTMKYIAINCVGSTFFVAGCGFVYATVGTLNLADLAVRTAALTGEPAAMVSAVSLVLLMVFALKTAAFPIFFWLPDTYPVVPAGVNGYFAGLLTKVGLYSLLRVFVMTFRQPGAELALDALLAMSAFTMLFGVLGAMCQWEMRRILSWHIISQVGYMVMGIGLAGIGLRAGATEAQKAVTVLAIAGTIFYVVHHIVVKSCLFLISGICERVTGTQELRKMGGVLDLAPGVAGMFLVASFSLAGMPPFSGFVSKLVLVRAGLAGGAYLVVAVSIITSFLTLYSMTKIWNYAFWRDRCREKAGPSYRGMMVPTGVLVAFTVVMGLFAQPFMSLANEAATSVSNPQHYIDKVFSIGVPPLPVGEVPGERESDTEVTP